MKIDNHLLTDVPFEASPNHSGNIQPDTIVIHYTAGASAESSVRTLCNPDAGASAHVVIGRDGSITQLVHFNVKAWHAGKSSFNGRTGLNNYSVGIEIDNAGILEKAGEAYVSWFGRKYAQDEGLEARHRNEDFKRYWHLFTEAQITAATELCEALLKAYDIRYILGHEEISPGRKHDPGPAFPLDKIRERLLEKDRSKDEGDDTVARATVAVDALNFRDAPGAEGNKISKPLKRGTKLRITGRQGPWYKVIAEQEGWVMGSFIDKNEQA